MLPPNQPQALTVVGAGLVGSLLSIYLARRGHQVTMLERRPDMRRQLVDGGRSINLAVSARGLRALREVGLEDEVLRQAIPMRGRVMHAVDGTLTFQPYGKDDSEYINSVSRAELNKTLMTAAEGAGNVRIQFETRVSGRDFAKGLLHTLDSAGAAGVLQAPIVMGTDGSASHVRQAMDALTGHRSDASSLDYGYKELTIAPLAGGDFALEKHALHIWPRGSFMLIALPNFDGSFTCTLFLPHAGEVSFEHLRTPTAVRQFFAAHFADALPLMPDLEEAFFAHPVGSMTTVKCSPWHVDGTTLLLGDAAHAIVPFFGQGMNCGFEDCSILAAGLDSGRFESWEGLFARFSSLRKVHADAIADMAVENFVEMRDKVGNAAFLMAKEVEKRLQRAFPGEFLSRYAMVTFHPIPYRAALEAGSIADAILDELCRDLASPEQVDLHKAGTLIRSRFTPFLQQQLKGHAPWT